LDCFSKIEYELEYAIDKHSKQLIVSNVELFLKYCMRFYCRQFITHDKAYKGILERFENLLNEYFQTDKPQITGLPSVAYCATELNLSASYFGDLKKKKRARRHKNTFSRRLLKLRKKKYLITANRLVK
jgi:hypothetical protein